MLVICEINPILKGVKKLLVRKGYQIMNNVKSVMSKLDAIKIDGIGLVAYAIMAILLVIIVNMGVLPDNMLGAIFVLVLMGDIFYYLGANLPVFKTYLGGGAVFTMFAAAILATTGIVPASVVKTAGSFTSDMGFIDFFIVSLITSSILAMDRKMLLKAAVRFIPVAFLSMAVCWFVVGTVGMLMGNGFVHSVMYVAFPIMAGGVGAGIVPLSSIYAHGLGGSAGTYLSQLFPATVLGNVVAIIAAGVISKTMVNSKWNGHGKMMRDENDAQAGEKKKLDFSNMKQLGVGLIMAMSFYMIGTGLNAVFPKINTYAFIILTVIVVKALGILPEYYENSAVLFGQTVTTNMTHALLAGVGLSLLNLSVLAHSLNLTFVVLVLISVATIGLAAGIIGYWFGLYPIESAITAGFCNNSMGGAGNVAVLAASDRMNLIGFAQMGNRLGGAIMLVIAGFYISFFH
jgi:CCS family citrate carrier protein